MTEPIKLPPLPEARIVSYQTDSTMRRMELRTHSDEDMQAYARAAIEADRQERGEPVAWTLTQQQVIALAEELIVGASALGGMDDDGVESDVRLIVCMPGTVADDERKLNKRPILAFCIDEYPEEGVYPIDPANCETEHTTPQPQQQASEPVGEVFTMEPLDGSGDVKCHALLTKQLPSGTKLYFKPQPQQIPEGYTPADMASQGAQGFRDGYSVALDEANNALELLYAKAMTGRIQGDDLEPHDEMYNVGQLGQAHGISQAQAAIMALKSDRQQT